MVATRHCHSCSKTDLSQGPNWRRKTSASSWTGCWQKLATNFANLPSSRSPCPEKLRISELKISTVFFSGSKIITISTFLVKGAKPQEPTPNQNMSQSKSSEARSWGKALRSTARAAPPRRSDRSFGAWATSIKRTKNDVKTIPF